MKNRILNYFPMIVFLGVSVFYFCNFLFEIGVKILPNKTESTTIESVDWAVKYPFKDYHEQDTIERIGVEDDSFVLVDVVESMIKKTKASIEYYLKDSFRLNRQLIEFNGLINHVLGKHVVTGMENSVIQLKNGELVQADESMSPEDYTYVLDEVLSFANYVTTEDIPFLYMQMPNKVCKYNPQLPLGMHHNLNKQMDKTVNALQKEGYNTLDLRDVLHVLTDDHYSLFYHTDHHWRVETAFYAAEAIKDYLEMEPFSIEAEDDVLNRENFYEVKYENSFLGYLGRQVTLGNVDPEDFTLLLPNDDINYSISCPGRDLYKSGVFKDVLINWDMYDEEIGLYDKSYYDAILYGNQAITTITNESVKNDSKILLIKDSFSLPMAMYLSTVYHEIILIDIRLNQGQFNGSVRAFVDEYRPDVVVLAMFPDANVAYRLE